MQIFEIFGPNQLKHVLQIYESTGKGLVAQRLSITDVHAANLQVFSRKNYKIKFKTVGQQWRTLRKILPELTEMKS